MHKVPSPATVTVQLAQTSVPISAPLVRPPPPATAAAAVGGPEQWPRHPAEPAMPARPQPAPSSFMEQLAQADQDSDVLTAAVVPTPPVQHTALAAGQGPTELATAEGLAPQPGAPGAAPPEAAALPQELP